MRLTDLEFEQEPGLVLVENQQLLRLAKHEQSCLLDLDKASLPAVGRVLAKGRLGLHKLLRLVLYALGTIEQDHSAALGVLHCHNVFAIWGNLHILRQK